MLGPLLFILANSQNCTVHICEDETQLYNSLTADDWANAEFNNHTKEPLIKISQTVEDRGLIVDSNLRFRDPFSKIVRNAYMSLKQLYPQRHLLDFEKTKKVNVGKYDRVSHKLKEVKSLIRRNTGETIALVLP